MSAPSQTPALNEFEKPLDLLRECHRRSEHSLRVLLLLASNASVCVLTAEARAAVEHALNHFQESAPKHYEDEEESLLPRLKRSLPSNDFPAEEMISLLRNHRQTEVLLLKAERLGRLWLKQNLLSERDTVTLMSTINRLIRLYEQQIRAEEEVIFPLAEAVLTAAEQHTIGREMAGRRERSVER